MREMSRRRALSGFAGLTAATLASAAATGCDAARASAPAAAAAPASSRRHPPGTLLWHAKAARGADEPRIVVADGMVYVTGSGHNHGDSGTYVFDSKTGRLAWHIPGPRTFAAGSHAAFGFQVSNSDVTTVIAASAATGRTLWTHDAGHLLDDAKVGWLSYANGLVYIAAGTTTDNTTGQPTVRALDARTGRRVWGTHVGVPLQEPAVANGRVYVTTTDRVVALNATTGARLWESARVGANLLPLAVVDGVVYGTAFGPLGGGAAPPAFGLDGATGHELWHAEVPGIPVTGTGGIALFESFVIGVTGNPGPTTLQARHARSGKLAWTHTFPAGAALAAAAGVLYVGTGTHGLLAIAAATGKTLWSYRLFAPGEDAGVFGGRVYVLDGNGVVYALQA